MCLREASLAQREADFRQLANMLAQIFHFEFHSLLEALEDSYTDLDPDIDTRRVDIAREREQGPFVDLLDGLLNKANYERISEAELNQALNESSLFKIRLHVDFSDFAEVSLFARGQSLRSEVLPTWFGLALSSCNSSAGYRQILWLDLRQEISSCLRLAGWLLLCAK